MGKTVEVILNSSSGTSMAAVRADELREMFAEHGIAAEIRLAGDGSAVLRLAEEAASGDARIVVAAGGDGTVSAVAARLINSDKTFAVLPLGTLNNFSKDLGIPAELAKAVAAISDGVEKMVDLAEVNGRIFINNSSIGLYPRIVKKREHQQQRLGRGKWWAAAWATWRFLWFSPFLKVKLTLGGTELRRKTPFVFVGNNDYEMEFYSIGRRLSLENGSLSIYLLHRSGRSGLFLLIVRTLFGRLRQASDFEEFSATEISVETRRKRVYVARDGEVETMASPLHYRILPRSLRVIVPKAD